MPQARYRNQRGLQLHRWGKGPFCKFRIPSHLQGEGVYLLSVNSDVRYVGECESLSARFNMGYGQISPRNCYEGGQRTNCKVNQLVLEAARRGHDVELWFHDTSNRKDVEAELIAALAPLWNKQGKP
jgi:hypothetical protein